jgi:predicted 2-oxoglutarate/Fe(II)-dependent dioxygenase YbiX
MIREDTYCRPEGVLRVPAFMSAHYCQELCAAAKAGRAESAVVITASGPKHDEYIRKTDTIEVPSHLIDTFVEKVQDSRKMLENEFRLKLGALENPAVLAYGRGGHFLPHIDSSDDPEMPSYIRNRAVSLVLFLNSPSAALRDGAYGGGTLTFFRVSRGTTPGECRVPVVGEAGTLVVFPSHWHHGVTPVQHGMRWTLVTWIAGAGQKGNVRSSKRKK